MKNKLYFVYLLSTFLILLHITILTKYLEKLALSRYFCLGECIELSGVWSGGGVREVGVVNRCRTDGSNYHVTIIYLISLYLTIDRRKVTKLLDIDK